MDENHSLAPIEHRALERPAAPPAAILKIGGDDSDSYFYLRAYWHILRKRCWTVLTVAIVLTTLVAIISFKMQPVYEAVARVEIEAETPQIQSLSDLDRVMPTDQAFVETQVRVIQSDTLAWKTIQQLRLEDNLAFVPPRDQAKIQQANSPANNQSQLIELFKDNLRVERVRDTRVVEIKFQSTDAELAAQVANTVVDNHMEHNFRKKYDATRQASGWMEQQLDELKAKVEKSQQALVDYERQYAIVNVSDKQNVAEQRLSDLSKELTNAQSNRLEKESLYDLVKSSESQVAFIVQNELLQRFEEKHADLKTQYVDALGQYGPNFPKVIRLRDQVNEIQSIIDRERKRIVARIHNDYMAASGREKLLASAVAREKVEVGRFNQLLIQHNVLKRESDTNQQLYENLLQRLKDATVSAGLRATNIHMVDRALTPSVPVRPKKLLNIAVGLLVGLVLGITLAFIEEGVDNSVKGAEDVEKLVASPVLAVIPDARADRTRSSWLKSRGENEKKKMATNGRVELTVLNRPGSSLAESFRTLRTSILLSCAPRPPRAILVTSPQPSEGKTCTSLNLAIALAQRGARVLIMDSDLRRPGIATPLGLSDQRGLSGLLTGADGIDQVLFQPQNIPNLWAIPGGPRPPNPAELLSSSTMEELLQRLRKMFDHIVLDSPPVLMVTDATILSTLVDGVVVVAQPGLTTRGALVRAYKTLQASGARILGVALNRIDSRTDGGYYYGAYYSRYYHSYFDDEPSRQIVTTKAANSSPAPVPRPKK